MREDHTLEEHLEHLQENGIPIVCACGHEEQATEEGLEAMRRHAGDCPRRKR